MKWFPLSLALVLVGLGVSAPQAYAIPALQLYIEGATFDTTTKTWVIHRTAGKSFNLWAIGNTAGPGGHGTIKDVMLTAAYDADNLGFGISLTETTTSIPGVIDPLTPAPPTFDGTNEGGTPTLGTGGSLPAHGIYGPGVNWVQFSLGDFSSTNESIGNFDGSSPFPTLVTAGQLNVYEVLIEGTGIVHFDLFNHIEGSNHSKFAPFSHDAQTPETSSLVLWGVVGGVFAAGCWFRRKRGAGVP